MAMEERTVVLRDFGRLHEHRRTFGLKALHKLAQFEGAVAIFVKGSEDALPAHLVNLAFGSLANFTNGSAIHSADANVDPEKYSAVHEGPNFD
eukprot:SAG11_NODE_24306_length_375_cov_0.923913_1_plen_93_part_10